MTGVPGTQNHKCLRQARLSRYHVIGFYPDMSDGD